MLTFLIYGMVYCGAALMVYNIYGFIRFARSMKSRTAFEEKGGILHIPIVLLVMFLLGYLAVGILGKPDLIVSAILFFGSVFVFIMYLLLNGITRRLIESEQLERELRVAEQTNEARTGFLSMVSHEMRTPMNVILGLDDIALRNPDLQPETRDQLLKIGLSARHMLGLINNILEFNEMKTAAPETRREEFALWDALDEVNAITQTVSAERGISYRVSVHEGANGTYRGDAMQIKQILLSILGNAVKYTDAPGTVTLSVKAGETEQNVKTLRFEVADTGIGIDEAFLPKVFSAFEQEYAGTTSRYGGTGLSLAVAKNAAVRMGGDITVESRKGVGSTFTFFIPLECADGAAGTEDGKTSEVSLKGRRVLIVEDLPENAEIVQDLLELEEMQTEHAENGQIALDMFSASQPGDFDAILMDLRMPVMDGLEAARRIRALDRPDAKRIPILALTANAFESDIRASQDAGMDAHLAKPTDAEMLYQTLRRLIARSEAAERGEENP